MVFPVVMYGCESWTVKKAERQKIDAFELWCWWTLESLLDCKEVQSVYPKGDQSWELIGRTDAEAETPILWPPHAKSWLIGKDPDAGRDWGQEKGKAEDWDGWMASPTRWTWVWVDSGSWWWTGRPGMQQFMGSQRVGHDWATELNWRYMFQRDSLISSHPLLSPMCSKCLCLLYYLASRIITSIFLDSIYINIQYLCLSDLFHSV